MDEKLTYEQLESSVEQLNEILEYCREAAIRGDWDAIRDSLDAWARED